MSWGYWYLPSVVVFIISHNECMTLAIWFYLWGILCAAALHSTIYIGEDTLHLQGYMQVRNSSLFLGTFSRIIDASIEDMRCIGKKSINFEGFKVWLLDSYLCSFLRHSTFVWQIAGYCFNILFFLFCSFWNSMNSNSIRRNLYPFLEDDGISSCIQIEVKQVDKF